MSAFQALHLSLCRARRASLAAAKSEITPRLLFIINPHGAMFIFSRVSNLCCTFSSSLYKAPWGRVMVYGLGHKVRRNGQLNLIEAICYPLDASPTNTGLTPPPTTNQYPSVIIPTDKVHIKLGGFDS